MENDVAGGSIEVLKNDKAQSHAAASQLEPELCETVRTEEEGQEGASKDPKSEPGRYIPQQDVEWVQQEKT